MRSPITHFALFALLGIACDGQMLGINGRNNTTGGDSAPCTDYTKCCPAEELRCEGNPDGVIVCTCDSLWDCSKNPNKCEAPKHVPGGGSWDCTWTEFDYSCSQKGSSSTPPTGGGDWTCTFSRETGSWLCKKPSPNPTNVPGNAAWGCAVDAGTNKIVCDRKPEDGGGRSDAGTPAQTDSGSGTPPPPGKGDWKCDPTGQQCEHDGGLPGGGSWNCHRNEMDVWICVGTGTPGGGGWSCERSDAGGSSAQWVCKKPDQPGEDSPPGGGYWACEKNSEFGTRCEQVPTPPEAPGLTPKRGETCVPGTLRWCDGLEYCGWGQMTCKPDGTWPTRNINGRLLYDCTELPTGARPNTLCACYHFYYNGECCERPDCVVPDNKAPQVCPQSAGQLCDYCNPQKPECNTPGGQCVATTKGESFCGQGCSADEPCPNNFQCVGIRTDGGVTYQCIPMDRSCYY